MVGRREFGALGLSAAAALAINSAVAQERKGEKKETDHDEHTAHNAMFRKCADACNDCQRECDSCATHCAHLLADGKKDHMTTLRTCQDCADACAAAARVVSRHGPFSHIICEACAQACDLCGKECEKFKDDEHMARCAEECRKCLKACREMIAHQGHGK
jgi:hypothetical protein